MSGLIRTLGNASCGRQGTVPTCLMINDTHNKSLLSSGAVLAVRTLVYLVEPVPRSLVFLQLIVVAASLSTYLGGRGVE